RGCAPAEAPLTEEIFRYPRRTNPLPWNWKKPARRVRKTARLKEGRGRAKVQGKHMGRPLPSHRHSKKRPPDAALGATLQELADSYDCSIATMRPVTRAA